MDDRLVEDIRKLIDISASKSRVDRFVYSRLNEHFKIKYGSYKNIWTRFMGYEIISWFVIKVNYQWGYNDTEFDEHLIINLKEDDDEEDKLRT